MERKNSGMRPLQYQNDYCSTGNKTITFVNPFTLIYHNTHLHCHQIRVIPTDIHFVHVKYPNPQNVKFSVVNILGFVSSLCKRTCKFSVPYHLVFVLFLQSFKNVKTVFISWAVQKQAAVLSFAPCARIYRLLIKALKILNNKTEQRYQYYLRELDNPWVSQLDNVLLYSRGMDLSFCLFGVYIFL